MSLNWKKSLVALTIGTLVLFPAVNSGFLITPATAKAPHGLFTVNDPSATPTASSDPNATPTETPTSTETPTPTETPSPSVTPFDPALYSINEASSLWVVVDKKLPLNPKTFVPKNLVKPKFPNGVGQNPFGIKLAKPAAKAVIQMATAMKQAGKGVLF